jgi:hypothetical protein
MKAREVSHMKKLIRSVMAALAIRPKAKYYWWEYLNL